MVDSSAGPAPAAHDQARHLVVRPTGARSAQPRKEGGFSTRAAAERALRILQDRLAAGSDLRSGQQHVDDYLIQWLAGKAALAEDTRTSYATHLRLYLIPALGGLALDELRDSHIEEMYDAMRAIGRTPMRPTPVLRLLLAARTQDPAGDRPLFDARLRRVHATLMTRSTAQCDGGRSR